MKRPRAPRRPAPAPATVINKVPDLAPDDDAAALLGWLGKGYAPPAGRPWEALPPDDRALFDRATARLRFAYVPRAVADVLCWSGGAWHATCRRIVDAAEVEVYPQRQHIRLIPRPPVARLLREARLDTAPRRLPRSG